MSDNWRVLVHLSTFNKIEYNLGDKPDMAREYASFILERGCRVTDERGVETYFPVHMIHKVKVVPPGVDIKATEVKFPA
jgi:hypothetical protein